jgi:hypothetical protein
MKTKQSLSIIWCFKQSISLTFRNFFAFLGAAVLVCIFSVLSLGFMFPCLMTGLENMYLRAKTGEQVKATDVFMHKRKWWSLYLDSVVLAWHIGWPIAAFGFAISILSIPISETLNPQYMPIVTVSYLAVFILLGLWSMFRESNHLHALNLAAEFGLRGAESRHLSKLSVKRSRWKVHHLRRPINCTDSPLFLFGCADPLLYKGSLLFLVFADIHIYHPSAPDADYGSHGYGISS